MHSKHQEILQAFFLAQIYILAPCEFIAALEMNREVRGREKIATKNNDGCTKSQLNYNFLLLAIVIC